MKDLDKFLSVLLGFTIGLTFDRFFDANMLQLIVNKSKLK
jgi:F0F1-type ATP synthase assembly protein I